MGLRRGMMARSGASSVSFVAASGANYVGSATSINTPSAPSGIATGDGLFAIAFARSALTPPAGWTLIASQVNTGTVTQTLYVYRKDAVTTADASTAFSWTQAASGRMGLAYVVARSSTGTITVAQTGTVETDTAPSTAYPHNVTVPTLTAAANGELFLFAASSERASAPPDNSTWVAPTGGVLRTTATQVENRMIAGTQNRSAGQSNASPMTFNTTGAASDNFYSALTVRLAP